MVDVRFIATLIGFHRCIEGPLELKVHLRSRCCAAVDFSFMLFTFDSALKHASHYSLELGVKLVPALTGRGAKVLAAAGQKLIEVGQWSSSAVYGNPTGARHRQRVVTL